MYVENRQKVTKIIFFLWITVCRKSTKSNQNRFFCGPMYNIENQQKNKLKLELEFEIRNSNKTHVIGEIQTNILDSRKVLIILLSFIFGLLLSLIMVFINNALKAFKEE